MGKAFLVEEAAHAKALKLEQVKEHKQKHKVVGEKVSKGEMMKAIGRRLDFM